MVCVELTFLDGTWGLYISELGKSIEIQEPTAHFFKVLSDQALIPDFVETFLNHYKDPSPQQDLYDFANLEVKNFKKKISNASFWDYTDQIKTQEIDREEMRCYQEKDPQPDIFLEYPNIEYIPLPHPACVPPHNPISKLGFMFFYNFGCLREIEFHEHKALLKCVPSLGARHPFEVYMNDPFDIMGLGKGYFHYSVKEHALGRVSDAKELKHSWSYPVSFDVSVMVDRYQWRYRNSYHYQELFLELGHLESNLQFTAKHLDILLGKSPFLFSKDIKEIMFSSFLLQGF